MQPDQAEFLKSHIVPGSEQEVSAETPTPIPASSTEQAVTTATEHVAPDMTVTGVTTFQNLLDWGVSQETIETILGKAMPDPQTVIKDYAIQLGQTFPR
jgi:hypothetical protein